MKSAGLRQHVAATGRQMMFDGNGHSSTHRSPSQQSRAFSRGKSSEASRSTLPVDTTKSKEPSVDPSSAQLPEVTVGTTVIYEVAGPEWRWAVGTVQWVGEEAPSHEERLVRLEPLPYSAHGAEGTLGARAARIDEEIREKSAKRDALEAALADARSQLTKHRQEAEAQAAKARSLLDAARHDVAAIDESHLRELRCYRSPPQVVRLVLEATVTVLQTGRILSRNLGTNWEEVQSAIRLPDFIQKILRFDTSQVTDELRGFLVEKYFRDPTFTLDNAAKASKAVEPLLQWLTAQIGFFDAKADLNKCGDFADTDRDNLKQKSEELNEARNDLERLHIQKEGVRLAIESMADDTDAVAATRDPIPALPHQGTDKLFFTVPKNCHTTHTNHSSPLNGDTTMRGEAADSQVILRTSILGVVPESSNELMVTAAMLDALANRMPASVVAESPRRDNRAVDHDLHIATLANALNQLKESEASLKEEQERNAQLEKDLANAQAALAEAKKDLNSHTSDRDGLGERSAKLTKALLETQTELDQLKDMHARTVAEAKAQQEILKRTNASQQQRIKELEDQLADALQKIASLEKTNEAIHGDLDELRLTHSQLVASNEQQVKEYEATLQQLQADQQATLDALNQQHDSDAQQTAELQAQLENDRAEHAKELERLKAELVKALADAAAQLEAERALLSKRHDADLAQAQATNDAEKARVRSEHANELEKERQAHAKELERLRGENAKALADAAKERESENARNAKRRDADLLDHEKELERLRADHAKALADAKARSDAEKAVLAETTRGALAKMESECDAEVAAAQANASKQVEKDRAEHAKELERLKAELAKALADAAAQQASASKKSDKERADHANELEKERQAHAKELERLRGENAKALADAAKERESENARNAKRRDADLLDHEKELERLRADHAKALADAKARHTDAADEAEETIAALRMENAMLLSSFANCADGLEQKLKLLTQKQAEIDRLEYEVEFAHRFSRLFQEESEKRQELEKGMDLSWSAGALNEWKDMIGHAASEELDKLNDALREKDEDLLALFTEEENARNENADLVARLEETTSLLEESRRLATREAADCERLRARLRAEKKFQDEQRETIEAEMRKRDAELEELANFAVSLETVQADRQREAGAARRSARRSIGLIGNDGSSSSSASSSSDSEDDARPASRPTSISRSSTRSPSSTPMPRDAFCVRASEYLSAIEALRGSRQDRFQTEKQLEALREELRKRISQIESLSEEQLTLKSLLSTQGEDLQRVMSENDAMASKLSSVESSARLDASVAQEKIRELNESLAFERSRAASEKRK